MYLIAAIPLTCWLCALIAIPRCPRVGNEVEELVYARLLGRQQWLVLLASVLTGAALLAIILALPSHAAADPGGVAEVGQVCTDRPANALICYTRQPGGGWRVQQGHADGTVTEEGIVSRPPPSDERVRGGG